ncbi:hypothetical protein SAMN06265222_107165 [Neorhodopirellula lusitana]|uniref:Zinc ribbon domain-containing protein n=1 Tax=Neorhodopirellula lusitana TaxID=445327 RepID=A0ABY1Q742_9BACT|nr:hypothetical protein [Neorhodopirellula lusitana]SMP61774.1 hypothetical protein SAMN06265222_107165 [Neorhodopirellula lusitana]
MPIPIKCQCGKSLSVRDELAGKAVKCPSCGKPVRVPAASGKPAAGQPARRPAGAPASPARPAPARPAPVAASPGFAQPASSSSSMDDLFAEEGMNKTITAICPACTAEMVTGAVMCMKCGYNQQTGERMMAHRVAGVDIDAGEMALTKAEGDIQKAKDLQKQMLGSAGMPPWMLALVLFILGSATGIAVLAVNASRRAETIEFSPMKMFLNLGGSAFLMVAIGAILSLILLAFRTDRKEGLLSLTVLYLFVFATKHKRGAWKILGTAIICGTLAGLFFMGASKY